MIKTLEVDRWSEPDEQRRVRHVGMAKAQDAFDQLERHLKEHGLLPDEYFLFSSERFAGKNCELPNYDEAICKVNFGESEGIYLDIYFVSRDESGKIINTHFATGKTLSTHAEAYRHMGLISGECSMMLNARNGGVYEQWELAKRDRLFQKTFERRAKPLGFTLLPADANGDRTLVFKGVTVGTLERNDDLLKKQGVLSEALTEQLHDVYYTTLEMVQDYANAPPLTVVQGEKGFRKLCDMNDIVLAGRLRKDGSFEFVTWLYTYNHTGVGNVRYFEEGYTAAKQDFVQRAELIPPSRLFTDEELTLMRSALEAAGQTGSFFMKKLSLEDIKTWESVSGKLNEAAPHVEAPRQLPAAAIPVEFA